MPHGLLLLPRVHQGLPRKGLGTRADPTTVTQQGWHGWGPFLPVTLRCFSGFESQRLTDSLLFRSKLMEHNMVRVAELLSIDQWKAGLHRQDPCCYVWLSNI